MWNLITNIGSWVLVCLLIFISTCIDRKNYCRPSIIAIVLTAMMVGVSVVLTNLVGYNLSLFSTFIKLTFGAFVIFVCGALFGPFMGCLAGLTSDSLGAIINIQGGYNAIFTLESVLYGFAGGLVLLKNQQNYWWIMRFVLYYNFVFVISSFGLDTLWLDLVFGANLTVVMFVIKLVKWPIELSIYLCLAFFIFTLLYYLLQSHSTANNIWCLQNPLKIRVTRITKRFTRHNDVNQQPAV